MFLAHTQIELVIESKLANSSKILVKIWSRYAIVGGPTSCTLLCTSYYEYITRIFITADASYSLLLLLYFCSCFTENKLVTATYHYYYCFLLFVFIRCCAPAFENFNYEPIDFISVWCTGLVDVLQVFPFSECEISAHKTCKHILCSAFF